jgi:hypothetical protein
MLGLFGGDLEAAKLLFEMILAISTFAAVIAAFVTALILRKQMNDVHKMTSAQVFYQLGDKFYDTDLMRALRQRAAFELTSNDPRSTFSAFDEVANFFDSVGTLVRGDALDAEMVTHMFRRRALTFWYKADELGVLKSTNLIHKTRWDNYRELVRTMEYTYARIYKKSKTLTPQEKTGRLSPDEMDDILRREKALVTIKDEQRSMASISAAPEAVS